MFHFIELISFVLLFKSSKMVCFGRWRLAFIKIVSLIVRR